MPQALTRLVSWMRAAPALSEIRSLCRNRLIDSSQRSSSTSRTGRNGWGRLRAGAHEGRDSEKPHNMDHLLDGAVKETAALGTMGTPARAGRRTPGRGRCHDERMKKEKGEGRAAQRPIPRQGSKAADPCLQKVIAS